MIGVASPSFCQVPFRDVLERISEHFELWEVLPEGMHTPKALAEGVSYGRDSLGMRFQVHAPMSDTNLGSVYEPMRIAAVKEMKQTIEMCRRLDIPLVTVHPGFVNGIAFLDRSKALEMTKRSVGEVAVFAREMSVTVAVENLPANINATCTHAKDLLNVIEGTGLGICFDMGHANTAGQLDEFLLEVHRFRNVHLHNNEGQWDQHNIIDDGSADVRKVVSVLRSSYKGNIVIESTDLESAVESKKRLEKMLG